MGMGSSGGGGSSGSGRVEYPAYMQRIHGLWLDSGGTDSPTYSVTDLFNTALTNNPFTGVVSYDPDVSLDAMTTSLATFAALNFTNTLSEALGNTMVLAASTVDDSIIDLETTTSRINTLMDAYSDQLDADLEAKALPTFERGMQDINAVMSSAFVIGRALILAEKDRNLAKMGAEMYMAAYKLRLDLITHGSELQLKYFSTRAEFLRAIAHMTTEIHRIKVVAKREEFDTQLHVDESEAKWDLELYQHCSNVLAGIAGGSHFVPNGPNKTMSAIGGAIGGVAAGAQIGSMIPGVGTGIGAGIGGVLGLVGGLFG